MSSGGGFFKNLFGKSKAVDDPLPDLTLNSTPLPPMQLPAQARGHDIAASVALGLNAIGAQQERLVHSTTPLRTEAPSQVAPISPSMVLGLNAPQQDHMVSERSLDKPPSAPTGGSFSASPFVSTTSLILGLDRGHGQGLPIVTSSQHHIPSPPQSSASPREASPPPTDEHSGSPPAQHQGNDKLPSAPENGRSSASPFVSTANTVLGLYRGGVRASDAPTTPDSPRLKQTTSSGSTDSTGTLSPNASTNLTDSANEDGSIEGEKGGANQNVKGANVLRAMVDDSANTSNAPSSTKSFQGEEAGEVENAMGASPMSEDNLASTSGAVVLGMQLHDKTNDSMQTRGSSSTDTSTHTKAPWPDFPKDP